MEPIFFRGAPGPLGRMRPGRHHPPYGPRHGFRYVWINGHWVLVRY